LRHDYARHLSESGDAVKALGMLHELVTEDAQDTRAWIKGGEIALSRSEFLEFASDWTGEAVRQHPASPPLRAQRAEALMLAGKVAEARGHWEMLPPGHPRSDAARVLCLLAGADASGVVPCAREAAVSREFLQWYQRLVALGAENLVRTINGRMNLLRQVLPSAGQALHHALQLAAQEPGQPEQIQPLR
jgi:hypothetical protein